LAKACYFFFCSFLLRGWVFFLFFSSFFFEPQLHADLSSPLFVCYFIVISVIKDNNLHPNISQQQNLLSNKLKFSSFSFVFARFLVSHFFFFLIHLQYFYNNQHDKTSRRRLLDFFSPFHATPFV